MYVYVGKACFQMFLFFNFGWWADGAPGEYLNGCEFVYILFDVRTFINHELCCVEAKEVSLIGSRWRLPNLIDILHIFGAIVRQVGKDMDRIWIELYAMLLIRNAVLGIASLTWLDSICGAEKYYKRFCTEAKGIGPEIKIRRNCWDTMIFYAIMEKVQSWDSVKYTQV